VDFLAALLPAPPEQPASASAQALARMRQIDEGFSTTSPCLYFCTDEE
jgi:hypothetical protein